MKYLISKTSTFIGVNGFHVLGNANVQELSRKLKMASKFMKHELFF